jgi:hypothetical protein
LLGFAQPFSFIAWHVIAPGWIAHLEKVRYPQNCVCFVSLVYIRNHR